MCQVLLQAGADVHATNKVSIIRQETENNLIVNGHYRCNPIELNVLLQAGAENRLQIM